MMSGRAIERLAVVGKSEDPRVPELLRVIVERARGRGIEVAVESALDADGLARFDEAQPDTDVLITLGGDGTLLRGARSLAGTGVPVLGVNLGRLGFLTTAPIDGLEQALDQLFAGEWELDRRSTLSAEVRGGDGAGSFVALNDVVVHTSGMARVVRLRVTIGDGEEVASFAGDGLIVSTPTGSTAYSLSAGGPVVAPGVPCMIITPICPHILSVRPLVVPLDSDVKIEAAEQSDALFLTVDGQVARKMEVGETVSVGRGPMEIPLVRLPGYAFFTTLKTKLGWAHRSQSG